MKNYSLHLLYLAQKLRFPVVLLHHNSKPKQTTFDVTYINLALEYNFFHMSS